MTCTGPTNWNFNHYCRVQSMQILVWLFVTATSEYTIYANFLHTKTSFSFKWLLRWNTIQAQIKICQRFVITILCLLTDKKATIFTVSLQQKPYFVNCKQNSLACLQNCHFHLAWSVWPADISTDCIDRFHAATSFTRFNSLAPGRCGCNIESVIFISLLVKALVKMV